MRWEWGYRRLDTLTLSKESKVSVVQISGGKAGVLTGEGLWEGTRILKSGK